MRLRPAAKARPRPSAPRVPNCTSSKGPESKATASVTASNNITWTRTRSTPLLYLVIAAVFLGVCLLGSLMLRTQMVQNSFEASQIETHITQLTQDVEDDQAKLDELDASLPSKAEEMGMVPQKGALTIDLNGYQANASGDKTR